MGRAWGGIALALLTAIAVGAYPRVAHAQATGFALDRFEPSERGSHWFALDSLDMRGDRPRPALGVVAGYQLRPLAIYEPDGSVRAAIVGHVLTTHVGGSLVLWERVRVGANLPVVVYAEGERGTLRGVTYEPPRNAQSLGDGRLSVDARLFGRSDGAITVGLGAQLWIPTGSVSSYAGDGGVRAAPRVQGAGVVGPLAYAGRVGLTFRSPDASDFASVPIDHDLTYGLSAGARLLDGRVVVGPELYGTTVLADAFKTRSSPLEILVGGHAMLGELRAGLGVGTGLVSGYGAAAVRALASLEWAPGPVLDTDGDGVLDKDDACPTLAGVRSDDPSKNGCPPPPRPVDTDGDGIPDDEDACMDVFGVRTNDPRTNGCIDRDKDGIMDPLDACPFQAGPPSQDPKTNGCPPPDKDGDGVLDADDACPTIPGVKTSDPKTNGCPKEHPDRDGDGIPNDVDACPDFAGKPDPDPTKNGCPKAYLVGDQIRITEQVRFKVNGAVIEPGKDSEEVLVAVRLVLEENPTITKVRVEGHTDNRGAAAANKKLSQARAAAVVEWLVKHGVDAARLTSVGHGMERPIDANDTEEGRQANRRVEFHIEARAPSPPAAGTPATPPPDPPAP
jgi:OmpA-OmpF porin, OOP family